MKSVTYDPIVIEALIKVFKTHFNSKQKAVKTTKLLAKLKSEHNIVMCPQTFRDVLGHIRRSDMISPAFIVSSINDGYWFTNDAKELREFLFKLLDRASNMYENVMKLHNRTKLHNKKTVNAEQIPLFGL